ADTVESRIEQFLTSNKGSAFTESEIVNQASPAKLEGLLGALGYMTSYWSVSEALKNLIKESRVKAKVVKKQYGDETFYSLA
ncbi:MAG: hypothetical protein ACRECH_16905, partial [Nitrososphaerales archaeon]